MTEHDIETDIVSKVEGTSLIPAQTNPDFEKLPSFTQNFSGNGALMDSVSGSSGVHHEKNQHGLSDDPKSLDSFSSLTPFPKELGMDISPNTGSNGLGAGRGSVVSLTKFHLI
jgi:hypothetical protein